VFDALNSNKSDMPIIQTTKNTRPVHSANGTFKTFCDAKPEANSIKKITTRTTTISVVLATTAGRIQGLPTQIAEGKTLEES
jgi:hypothetical protein